MPCCFGPYGINGTCIDEFGSPLAASPQVYGGDPRRPNEAHPYRAPKIKEEDQSPDYMALLSLVFGMFGLLLKVPCSCLCCCCRHAKCALPASSMANSR